MAKLILGVAGDMGSGKESISKHVVMNYDASSHNFSDILSDILRRLHLEIVRENFASLSLVLRKTFGEDILAKTMYHDSFDDEKEIVVVQGIRRIQDMEYLKQLPNFKFIFVEADMETRFERVKKRHEKANDETITWQEFQDSHKLETEQTIMDLRNYADYTVDNNGTYNELHDQIDQIIKKELV